MRFAPGAERRLATSIERILGGKAEAAPLREELRSHLHAAAAAGAAKEGRDEVMASDVDAAVAEGGGDDALAAAFGRPRDRFGSPPVRAVGGGILATRVLGAIAGLAAAAYAIATTSPSAPFLVLVAIAVLGLVLAAAAIVHLLRRRDLSPRGRLAWLVALVALEPVAGILYFWLGREGSRQLAARVVGEGDEVAA